MTTACWGSPRLLRCLRRNGLGRRRIDEEPAAPLHASRRPLADASSLLGPAWPQDNLITAQPAVLYNGRIEKWVSQRSLPVIFSALERELGPFTPVEVLPGAYAWRVRCNAESGRFTLEIPLAVDEAGQRGRRRVDVPRHDVENIRRFLAAGLTRFVLPPQRLATLAGELPVAVLDPAEDYDTVGFERGCIQVRAQHAPGAKEIPLSLESTAELLTEMIAALAYHYEPGVDGGTALADVFVNGGDFVVKRRAEGTFDLRLTAARTLEKGIGPALLLCHLIRCVAYDPWEIGGHQVGIPVPMSNPSIAFEGVARGRRYRHLDTGSSEEQGTREAHRWIAEMVRTTYGRAYRPWAERFLEGRLPASFGEDLRERWWQLAPLRQRGHLLELRAQRGIGEDSVSAATELATFLEKRSSEVGRRPLDHAAAESLTAPRALANAETTGDVTLPPPSYAAAVDLLPSFATYMDAVLHDPEWGYYAHHVEIGASGHFNTHPEILSPHYGRWMATLAFRTWRDLLAHGELSDGQTFDVIELGAGNGRLARDFLDFVAIAARDESHAKQSRWAHFEQCLRYCIYETSDSLRARQRALLGERALIRAGDARRAGETLREQHRDGVFGMVVSNEVPDTFGAHKVAFARGGRARAALVLPRVEAQLLPALGDALASQVEVANDAVRQTCHLDDHPEDSYLDAATWLAVMRTLSKLPEPERGRCLSMLWFEEAYVPASEIGELAEHLETNAQQYAIALAAEDSGVVQYVGLHACRFVREVAASMRAGIVVTVDYGDSTWGLVQGARRGDFRLRVYGNATQAFVPRPNDPYTAAGTQDVTVDVSFSDLAHAGELAGLTVVHYGAEIDLARDDLPEVLRGGDHEPYSALLEPDIKVLVLGTRPSDVLTPVGKAQRLRYEYEQLPEERREEITRWEQALRLSPP